jgi:hypothetical protein
MPKRAIIFQWVVNSILKNETGEKRQYQNALYTED